jgi:hypothetical protein
MEKPIPPLYPVHWIFLVILLFMMGSCSHKFEGDVLDLGMYQWNLWSDPEATWTHASDSIIPGPVHLDPGHYPSCGWEEFHRGKGKLVRIPARMDEHLESGLTGSEEADTFRGVAWYHCRFTLPEMWEGREMALEFEEAGPKVDVYLNELFVGGYRGKNASFSLDVTGFIYYTLDNHLSVRVTDTGGDDGGITGSLHVRPGDSAEPVMEE